MTLSSGTQLGHYRILGPLGKGGMGEVYLAKDLRLDREVAVKVLPDRVASDQTYLSRFEREAKALAALAHPNILSIFDFGTEAGICYAVMEVLKGETLRSLIRGAGLSWKKAVEIAIPIAEGLAAAHSKGITHRDLKPENVFVTADGSIKILDFGLARMDHASVGEEESEAGTISRLTEPGIVVGTVPYMSPEQISGESVDSRSDIFSFGCMFYEMVTGKRPFSGSNAAETTASILKDEPAHIQDGAKVPAELERIIRRCLEKHPDKRVQSARDLAYDLKLITSESSGGKQVASRSARRSPAWVFFALVVVLLLAGTGWWLRDSLTRPSRGKSIAVLPFKNLSPDKESEYFCDGMTEDILTELSKIGDLKVISRTSVMQYKNSTKSLREIGKELGVATVLEGSVRKEGNRLRIVGQLVDAEADEHLWAETYDRELRDVFEIQSDVAKDIAAALQAELNPAQQIAKKPTLNVTAYDYYLRGLEYFRRYHKQDNDRAIELYQKAIQVDPNYALAYAALCEAEIRKSHRYGLPETSVGLAEDACNKAVSIDPNLAEVHTALHKIYLYRGWNQKAIDTLKTAVRLNPNYVPAVGNLGVNYYAQGKLDQALLWYTKFMTLDPANGFSYYLLGDVYFAMNDLPRAVQYLNKSLELQPDFLYPHWTFIEMYLAQGQNQQARQHAQKALSIDPTDNAILSYAGAIELHSGNYEKAKAYYLACTIPTDQIGFGYALWKLGEEGPARKLFEEFFKKNQDRIVRGNEGWSLRYEIAAINAIQGNKSEAYRWLQDAMNFGAINYRGMSRDPLLENLRGDPQFQQMMARVEARVSEMRRKAEQFNASTPQP